MPFPGDSECTRATVLDVAARRLVTQMSVAVFVLVERTRIHLRAEYYTSFASKDNVPLTPVRTRISSEENHAALPMYSW